MTEKRSKRKTYSVEFKEYVSKLVVSDGRKMVDISKELNIPYDTLQRWILDYRRRLQEEVEI